MLTGMQMKAVFARIWTNYGVRFAYIVGHTGQNGRMLAMGIWLPRPGILHANDNARR